MTSCSNTKNLNSEIITDIVNHSKAQEKLKLDKIEQEKKIKNIKLDTRLNQKEKYKLKNYKKSNAKRNQTYKKIKFNESLKLTGPYKNNRKLHKFINKFIKKYKVKRRKLNYIFSNVKRDVEALRLIGVVNGIETPRLYSDYTWTKYRKIFITKNRISKGIKTYNDNKKYFLKAEKRFGVPAEYLVAILGIETNYGTITGTFQMIDSLTSIALEHPRRWKFFEGELEALLHMNLVQNKIALDLKASYAGAFGYAQFMPSSFQEYAIDFDKDGKINFFNFPDAIGSIANYFKRFHWETGLEVATKLKHNKKCFNDLKMGFKNKYLKKDILKANIPIHINHYFFKDKDKYSIIKLTRKKHDELWLATHNFYVITRYNHSNYYAMAVHQLSQEIKKRIKK